MVTLYTLNNKLVKVGSKFYGSISEPTPPPSFDEVTIGSQTWMAKNLSIDDGQGGISSWTANYGQGDVVEYCYKWDAAVRVAESINGWHLPTKAEWETLLNTVGTVGNLKLLKSTYGWYNGNNGTDQYGFGLFPAGTSPESVGIGTILWSSTTYNEKKSYGITVTYSSYSINKVEISANIGSLRLIKD